MFSVCGVMLDADIWLVLMQRVDDVWTVWYTGCYAVPGTQLTTFVLLYSCKNNITVKTSSIAAETCYREHCQSNTSVFLLVTYTLYIFVYLVQAPTG